MVLSKPFLRDTLIWIEIFSGRQHTMLHITYRQVWCTGRMQVIEAGQSASIGSCHSRQVQQVHFGEGGAQLEVASGPIDEIRIAVCNVYRLRNSICKMGLTTNLN